MSTTPSSSHVEGGLHVHTQVFISSHACPPTPHAHARASITQRGQLCLHRRHFLIQRRLPRLYVPCFLVSVDVSRPGPSVAAHTNAQAHVHASTRTNAHHIHPFTLSLHVRTCDLLNCISRSELPPASTPPARGLDPLSADAVTGRRVFAVLFILWGTFSGLLLRVRCTGLMLRLRLRLLVCFCC